MNLIHCPLRGGGDQKQFETKKRQRSLKFLYARDACTPPSVLDDRRLHSFCCDLGG